MLIIGAKGFATEVLDVFNQKNMKINLAFYDDVNKDIGRLLYDTYPILRTQKEVLAFFEKNGNEFTIGIGKPFLRNMIALKFEKLGGKLESAISPNAFIGQYDIQLGEGLVILNGVNISNNVRIGKGTMIYYNAIITHDCKIGEFVEISPNVIILGRVSVGSFTHLGANCTILPNLNIGKNVIIGAGAVVTKDVPDNSMAIGVPAKIVKNLEPLNF
ncbi:acetyltransferase [Cellulophaga tyrosinoxydans]|uniref:Sugar O-acyltransferase, sialic acid O-acetyltransferase NeuD family n=1 Tax=Cellulophaga tyrosinoxydans TaxID=504486 RepID=A0A1W1YQJ8_9FLAO|nr:acetyltransferase [Cellulophaga tyrosinoxydans]SMC38392.1 sugar O-acyltransferase, sialic acid O-acetyltransferase NeuD family [Cellulophaga tyrosinoxydans]